MPVPGVSLSLTRKWMAFNYKEDTAHACGSREIYPLGPRDKQRKKTLTQPTAHTGPIAVDFNLRACIFADLRRRRN
jgi:hypothetical protein